MLRKTRIASFGLSSIFVSHAWATDWVYNAAGSQTNELTGGYGALVDPITGNFYNDGMGDIGYVVILDSGSSGNDMSNFVQTSLNVPLEPGVTYSDVGIGGTETFNVTPDIQAEFAPSTTPDADADTPSSYTSYGQYKFEAAQSDPLDGLLFFDILGTPVIQTRVMQVFPGNLSDFVAQGAVTNIAETHLLTSLPTNLPSHGVYHIPITYTNFVPASPPPTPTEALNPVVQGVTATAVGSSKGYTSNWLFDSGASFSIVTPALAALIGINTSAAPAFSVQGLGVGDQIVTFDGYRLSSLSIPLSDGQHLVFDGPVVFIPEVNNLPDELNGVLGENLWMQSTDNFDADTGEMLEPQASPFSQWYLDSPDNQVVLVDPNSAYTVSVPEPVFGGLLVMGGIGSMIRRPSRRNK